MSRMRGAWHRLCALWRRDAYGKEVAEELRFHLDLEEMQRAAPPGAPGDAADQARRQFGNVTYVREEVRRVSGAAWLDRVQQNVTYAVRGLRRSPGFTLTVVLTLGLGLGVNVAMFSLLDRVFVRAPGGVRSAAQVQRLYADHVRPKEPDGHLYYPYFSLIRIRAMEQALGQSARLGVFTSGESVEAEIGGHNAAVINAQASGSFFDVLGVKAARGRLFAEGEDKPDTPAAVAVISDRLWHDRFQGARSVIGETITIESTPYTVIGVAPPGFNGVGVSRVDVWLPPGGEHSYQVVTRIENSALERSIASVLLTAYRSVPSDEEIAAIRPGPLATALGPGTRDQGAAISLRLAGVASIVLIIAIANVSNLLLVRTTRRRREIRIRRALGVSRWRLCEQLLTEMAVLAGLAGLAAVLFAYWAGAALRALVFPDIVWAGGAIDMRVIAFTVAVSLMMGLATALAPIMHATSAHLIDSLRVGQGEAGQPRSQLRTVLLVAQAALSVVLLVGAGLFVQSLRNVEAIDIGYDRDGLLIAPAVDFQADPAQRALVRSVLPQVAARIARAPGVSGVAMSSSEPMVGWTGFRFERPDGRRLPMVGGDRGGTMTWVSPNFFRVAGLRVIAGRGFRPDDLKGGGHLVVTDALARAVWPRESAVGQCLFTGRICQPIIGVVADVHRNDVVEAPMMQVYAAGLSAPTTLVVRTTPEQQAVVGRMVALELQQAFSAPAPPQVRTMNEIIDPDFVPWRKAATLFTAMGMLALIVAVVGIYSVVAYSVSQRTNEMGIRLALGARAPDVMRLVIGEGMRTVLFGIGLGVALALALGRFVDSLLYGISPADPRVLAVAALVLVVFAALASAIPAMRAARVDPLKALRAD